MKKIALMLAVLACASMCLASCGDSEDSGTTTPATTTTVAKNTTTRTPPPSIEPTPGDEIVAPDLLDGSKFALDGNLSDYEGLHTISVIGEAGATTDTSHKKVTFYGAMTDLGLFLACDAYHDIYIGNSSGDWWTNSNFEFFIGAGNAQKYVYARGIENDCETSSEDVQAKMVTEQLTDGPTVYHTIVEAFVPVDYLSEGDILYNTIDIGVAWKTIGDLIIGGAGTASVDSSDEYWVPKGTWPGNSSPKPIVAPTGIWLPDEFTFEETAQ